MPECFALRKGRCTVLVVRKCQGEECPFYKTPEQYAADQQQALERIQALDPEVQEHIRRTYLSGATKASNL